MVRLLLSAALFILVLFVLAVQPAQSSPTPRLWNGDFDLEAIGNVACEWKLGGSGAAFYRDGLQGIRDIPVNETSFLSQRIPFCTPGGGYRATLTVASVSSSDLVVGLALATDSAHSLQMPEIQYVRGPGVVEISGDAPSHVLNLTVSVHNQGAVPGEVLLEGVTFEPVGMTMGFGEFEEDHDLASTMDAKKKVQEAFNEIEDLEFERSGEQLSVLMEQNGTDLPRREAAEALVGMFEVDKATDEHIIRSRPVEEWDQQMGIRHLRRVREEYPDQTAACAMATTKLGQFYLDAGRAHMAKAILESVPVDFPGTEGATWSRTFLINAYLWTDDVASASSTFEQLQADYDRGQVDVAPMGWAEQFLKSQLIAKLDPSEREEKLDAFREHMWKKYYDSFPEMAARMKEAKASRHMELGAVYKGVEDLRELAYSDVDSPVWVAAGKIYLAYCMREYATSQEHIDEAVRLLGDVVKDLDVPGYVRDNTVGDYERYQKPRPIPIATPVFDENLLHNARFTMEPHTWDGPQVPYRYWSVADGEDLPNWKPAMEEVARTPVLDGTPIAWNSVNHGGNASDNMHSRLLNGPWVVDESASLELSVWAAAGGWDGGSSEDVSFELVVHYTDMFGKPLGTDRSGSLASHGRDQDWQQLLLSSTSPADVRFATFEVAFQVEGEGHHAVGFAEASMVARRRDEHR